MLMGARRSEKRRAGMQPTPRRARPADAEAVAEIFLAARTDTMLYLPNLHTEDEIRLWIRDILLPGHEVVVAEVGDRPAGFAALDGDELAHLYVHPGLQGPGDRRRAARAGTGAAADLFPTREHYGEP